MHTDFVHVDTHLIGQGYDAALSNIQFPFIIFICCPPQRPSVVIVILFFSGLRLIHFFSKMAKVILATASYDHTIRFWEAPTGIPTRTIQYPDSQVNRITITPDKMYLAAAGNPHVRFFDIGANNPSPVSAFEIANPPPLQSPLLTPCGDDIL